MHDNASHPLLEQVPLTVSPFVHLPRATTLPYRYKAMPSALPPSIVDGAGTVEGASGRPAYVTSPSSSSAAHPDDILASCRALREHIARLQSDADNELRQFEERVRARELAEKRRVAPGWLDSEDRLLVPEKSAEEGQTTTHHQQDSQPGHGAAATTASTIGHAYHPSVDSTSGLSEMAATMSPANDVGADLDRAFGVMQLNK